MKISVIIPVYNVERFFEKCLRSLFGQTLESIEYIFINDCTPDNSMQLLDQILEEYPARRHQIKVINHEKNMGLWAARRDGMKLATGDYVISCDSDDWIDTNMYEKMYNKARKENADMVCCGLYWEYGTYNKIEVYPPNYFCDKKEIKNSYATALYYATWNKLIKRDLYFNYDIYPYEGINMWEDLGVIIRLRYLSKKTVILSEAYYHYNQRNENSIVKIPKLSSIIEQIQCASNIEAFFKEHKALDEFNLSIQNIKFKSKERLLFEKSTRDIRQWLSTFPETHKYILKYGDFSLKIKILYYIAAKGYLCSIFICSIFSVSQKLKKARVIRYTKKR
jgi:glycosyltransferase involved in cell wall biosynthesis